MIRSLLRQRADCEPLASRCRGLQRAAVQCGSGAVVVAAAAVVATGGLLAAAAAPAAAARNNLRDCDNIKIDNNNDDGGENKTTTTIIEMRRRIGERQQQSPLEVLTNQKRRTECTLCENNSGSSAPPPPPPLYTMSREPRLRGKVAVITGASRGIGQAIAVKFVREGCRVILLDVADCDETLDMIGRIRNAHHPRASITRTLLWPMTPHFRRRRGVIDAEEVAVYVPCDITDESQIERALRRGTDHFFGGGRDGNRKIHVLVNNACAFVFKSVEDATVADWMRSLRVNILGHALVTKHCLPYMKKKKGRHNNNNSSAATAAAYAAAVVEKITTATASVRGNNDDDGPSIIFLGSISSFLGQPDCATYAATKGAIAQLARNCAYDLSKYGIRVNTICPGTIETPISKRERVDHCWTFREWQEMKTKDCMMRRVGTPEEIAAVAVFFASSDSSYCTGAHLMVDGGVAACTVMQEEEEEREIARNEQ